MFDCSFVFPFDYTKISSHSNSSCLVPEAGKWAFRAAADSSGHLHAVCGHMAFRRKRPPWLSTYWGEERESLTVGMSAQPPTVLGENTLRLLLSDRPVNRQGPRGWVEGQAGDKHPFQAGPSPVASHQLGLMAFCLFVFCFLLLNQPLFCNFEIKPRVRGPYSNSSPKQPWMHPENG